MSPHLRHGVGDVRRHAALDAHGGGRPIGRARARAEAAAVAAVARRPGATRGRGEARGGSGAAGGGHGVCAPRAPRCRVREARRGCLRRSARASTRRSRCQVRRRLPRKAPRTVQVPPPGVQVPSWLGVPSSARRRETLNHAAGSAKTQTSSAHHVFWCTWQLSACARALVGRDGRRRPGPGRGRAAGCGRVAPRARARGAACEGAAVAARRRGLLLLLLRGGALRGGAAAGARGAWPAARPCAVW